MQHQQEFTIETADVDGARLIALHGALDLATAPDLCMAILQARDDGYRDVIVDLSDVDFCDSRGLCALYREERECTIHGVCLGIVLPKRSGARRIFELTAATEFLAIYPNLSVARSR